MERASKPVAIIPLKKNQLKDIHARDNEGTTEFSITRFLVPYLSLYEGKSIFMDSDMLVKIDIYDVLNEAWKDNGKSVYVCKHNYVPKQEVKAMGKQTTYPRKNWSSFMLFDNAKCLRLTPGYVNSATGLELHRFHWIADEEIGELPLEYNWLVGEYEKNDKAKIIHFTNGSPFFDGYQNSDYADEWRAEYGKLIHPLT